MEIREVRGSTVKNSLHLYSPDFFVSANFDVQRAKVRRQSGDWRNADLGHNGYLLINCPSFYEGEILYKDRWFVWKGDGADEAYSLVKKIFFNHPALVAFDSKYQGNFCLRIRRLHTPPEQ